MSPFLFLNNINRASLPHFLTFQFAASTWLDSVSEKMSSEHIVQLEHNLRPEIEDIVEKNRAYLNSPIPHGKYEVFQRLYQF